MSTSTLPAPAPAPALAPAASPSPRVPRQAPSAPQDAPLVPPLELGGDPRALIARPWPLTARGTRLVVRGARPADLPQLARLLARCTPGTRLGWSGRGGAVLPLVQQEAWLRRPGGVVVERAPGELVALGALRPAVCTGEEDPIAGAVEVLVQDAWQRCGVGSALVEHFAGALHLLGRSELQVRPGLTQPAADALLAALGGRARLQRHPHGRCPRVHVPRAALAGLGPLRRAASA
ncbi:hypothetical protein [Quadrisphaera sp. DSM 44207]|uniref:hypothetical protein n=1 Tax=Quadrisphaera sp. DSM 44207 TaxID=1881057 RepID=UPI0008854F1C|nr:hypothetical protein [Quadrisphaera sp. DSM 44207]SDQ88364.1 Ribosomal protein S18 acetylase RimI [Quadrisphaera sp. DSM 44207]